MDTDDQRDFEAAQAAHVREEGESELAAERAEEAGNTPVLVDPGDVLEACQAASAWASYLREHAHAGLSSAYRNATADRIDAASHRLHQSIIPTIPKPS